MATRSLFYFLYLKSIACSIIWIESMGRKCAPCCPKENTLLQTDTLWNKNI